MSGGRVAAIAGAAVVAAAVAVAVALPPALPGAGPTRAESRHAAGSDARAATRRDVRVTLGDRRLTLETDRVAAGRIVLEQRNDGTTDHDLVLVRTDRAPDRLPVGLRGVRPDLAGRIVFGRAASHHEHATDHGAAGAHGHRARHLRPGRGRTASVVLRPGRYVLLCPLPGHYEAGQRAALVVSG